MGYLWRDCARWSPPVDYALGSPRPGRPRRRFRSRTDIGEQGDATWSTWRLVFDWTGWATPEQIKQFVRTVERLGYDTLWYPESRGYRIAVGRRLHARPDHKLKLGSSIASIYARDAFTSRRGLLSLQALYGDRFILGLGVSHVPMVEGVRGHTYEKPVPAMRAYLDGITKGEAGADDWPIAIAALAR